jgi:hypothetical protein
LFRMLRHAQWAGFDDIITRKTNEVSDDK